MNERNLMNARERFIVNMTFQVTDRALLWEFEYWTGTLRGWYKESLPNLIKSRGKNSAQASRILPIIVK